MNGLPPRPSHTRAPDDGRQLVETAVIFVRTGAPQHGYGQSEVATVLADGTWVALWPTLGL